MTVTVRVPYPCTADRVLLGHDDQGTSRAVVDEQIRTFC